MALLETAPPPATIPGTHALSVVRRPGFQIFDADVLIGPDSHDLFHKSTVELSGDRYTDFLQNANGNSVDRRPTFKVNATNLRSLHLPATKAILSRLTESIRRMSGAPLCKEDTFEGLASHAGVANWAPEDIEFNRYSFVSGQDPHLSGVYRSGQNLGSYVAALVMLYGSRIVDVAKPPSSGENAKWSPLLPRRHIMLLQAPGLLEGQNDSSAAYKFGKIYPSPNNLLMTVLNHPLESPEPAKP
jgi:hypothetical protein